jgi:hypothetical protein
MYQVSLCEHMKFISMNAHHDEQATPVLRVHTSSVCLCTVSTVYIAVVHTYMYTYGYNIGPATPQGRIVMAVRYENFRWTKMEEALKLYTCIHIVYTCKLRCLGGLIFPF